jgi:hypothetical protein
VTRSADIGTSGHRTAGLETMTMVTDILSAAFRAFLQANNGIVPSNRSLILIRFSYSHYNGGKRMAEEGNDVVPVFNSAMCLADFSELNRTTSLFIYQQ